MSNRTGGKRKRRKPYDPINDMGVAERNAELLRRKQEKENREKTLNEIRGDQERKRRQGPVYSRSLKKYLRSLSKHKSFRLRAKELGITLAEYKTRYWATLSKEQKVLLDLEITRASQRQSSRSEVIGRTELRTGAVGATEGAPPKTKKKKLEGKELLDAYRSVIENGGTEIKASIECGWNYKTELGWFRQAVKKAIADELETSESGHNTPPAIPIPSRPIKEQDHDDQTEEVESEFRRSESTGTYTRKVRTTKFRSTVLKKHGSACACCGLDIESLLEAAHIRPVENNGTDHFKNGIPLCPTHHTAFDRLLFAIDPFDKSIIYASGYCADRLRILSGSIDLDLSFDDLLYRRLLFDDTDSEET